MHGKVYKVARRPDTLPPPPPMVPSKHGRWVAGLGSTATLVKESFGYIATHSAPKYLPRRRRVGAVRRQAGSTPTFAEEKVWPSRSAGPGHAEAGAAAPCKQYYMRITLESTLPPLLLVGMPQSRWTEHPVASATRLSR